ncbi:MAG: DUF1080 domain-containing protein, partial [Clostridia bacterium]|nr:DUF1080 domain-containing protein [Clostridia bacterium]
GCFTLPIELKLVKTSSSYRLIQNPVQEVENIKGESLFSITDKTYNNTNALQGVKSNSFELNAEIDVNNSSNFTLSFCLGDGDATTLTYNKSNGEITFNRTQSKYGFEALKNKGIHTFKVDNSTNANGIMKLRLFVDVSNIELYINDGYYYFIGRIQPFSSSQDMSLIGEKVVVKSLSVNKCKQLFVKEDASAIHVGDSSTIFALIGGADIVRDVYVLGANEPILTVGDSSKISATLSNGKLTIKALSSGVTYVRISAGNYYKDLEVLAYNQGESYFNNQIGNLTISGGKINISPLDMQIVSDGGDAVAFSNVNAKNVEYSADIRMENNGAGALLIRADGTNDNFYSVNIDKNANVVKFWKKVDGAVKDIAVKSTNINSSEFYNLKVVALGASIKVYLNNQLLIDAVDYSLTEGKLGLNVFQTSARFNNIKYTVLNAQEGNVDALGVLTKTNASVSVNNGVIDFNNTSGGGDAFMVGSVNASNFILKGEIAIGGEGAGAFILRYQDLNNFYCANLDTTINALKLWKKVNGNSIVVKQVSQDIVKGEFYSVKVEMVGASIKIYVNNDIVLDVLDSDFTSGKIGLNSWITDCYFKNISIEQGVSGYTCFGEITTQNAIISQNGGEFTLDNINGGDAFMVGSASCGNYTISGDISLGGVGAGSFILRYVDSNNFYCVNIDSEFNIVKVWKKVNGTSTIIAQHSTTINTNTIYNLKITLNGSNIKVSLNDIGVIDCQDNSLSYGKIGLNSWMIDVVVSNIKCYV